MKKVPITEIEPGQVVARPVATSNGMVMVQSGAVLTVEIIDRLLNLGVDVVWLEGAAADARPVEALLADLDRRFAGHEHDALMMELKNLVTNRIRQGATDASA
jgi:hypothetical protein